MIFILKFFLLIAGGLAFFAGIAFLFFPRVLLKFSEFFNNVFEWDQQALKYRLGLGISFFLTSLFLLFMAYYYYVRN